VPGSQQTRKTGSMPGMPRVRQRQRLAEPSSAEPSGGQKSSFLPSGVRPVLSSADQVSGPYHGKMRTPAGHAGAPPIVRLAAGLAAVGVVCFAAGLVIAYFIADHSSSDSSPSSLMAIGLGSAGILLLLLSALLFTGHGLGLLWRYLRRPPRGG